MHSIEFDDIQALVLRGYKELGFARFLVLRVADVAAARAWIGELRPTPASEKYGQRATNLAFTWHGLAALGVAAETLGAFDPEFREGLSSDEHRSRVLGDVGPNSPAGWDWGQPDQEPHAMLLLYAESQAKLDELDRAASATSGFAVVRRLETRTLRDNDSFGRFWFREHFGFRDGVAQPKLRLRGETPEEMRRGITKESTPDNAIAAGEVLFGYSNEYGTTPEGDAGRGDFGRFVRNGSHLVFRQLAQDVLGFWKYIRSQARDLGIDPVLLASKMVGRWPNGAPLVRAPVRETAGLEQFDSFGYAAADAKGHACPLASHIRRTNPRDALVPDPQESVRIVNRHRLVRRGRPYGEPVSMPLDPSAFLPRLDEIAAAPAVDRGLHFLCFNSNIRRQFEFVQQTWINNPKFAHQYDGPDPIVTPPGGGEFEIPGEPARRRVSPLQSFVTVRGGAYFFMPGLRALRAISGATGATIR
jgi:Dyp-type peroxidase family